MYHYKNPAVCVRYNHIKYESLYEEVLGRMRTLAKSVESGELLRSINKRMAKRKRTDKLEEEKTRFHARLSSLEKITKRLYEDNACGDLDVDSYHKFLKDYQNEQK